MCMHVCMHDVRIGGMGMRESGEGGRKQKEEMKRGESNKVIRHE